MDTTNIVLNATSIHESRKKYRKERYEAIKQLAPSLHTDLSSTIHWDGKLLHGLVRGQKIDRLAIIVSTGKIEQLLGVPEIASSTGENQAQAVYEALQDWCLSENIQSLCCDSTSSNTGRIKGACITLERLLGKDLLYLICRHHIQELVLKCSFEKKFGKTSSPDVQIFNKFEAFWKTANKNCYDTGISDFFVNESLRDDKEEILQFCLEYLKKDLARHDYKEFLELAIIFLGGELPKGIVFHSPGAHHHARWMSKAIYCLKIFIFRKQFFLTDNTNELKCRDVCIFILKIYIKQWFLATSAISAPYQDLKLLKNLFDYKSIDEDISSCALKKLIGHLWYLTPELSALSFFDSDLSSEEKQNMVKALESDSCKFVYEKRLLINQNNLTELVESNMSDFICKKSLAFFDRYNLNRSFLKKDPSTWNQDSDFIHGLETIKNLKVVNDAAERGVKLMTDFNNILTRDEEQKQYLLPVIKDYRRCFPNCNRETLSKSFQYV